MMANPFDINNYTGPANFCDREEETKQLLANIRQGKHTAFFALRRIGKTALIHHVLHQAGKSRNCIYADIYPTQNLKDLVNELANSISTIYPENKKAGKKFWDFIRLFRPVITLDEFTGAPKLSLDISRPPELERTLPQLFQFLDSQSQKTCIAIDEFQQILNYPEKTPKLCSELPCSE